MVSDDRRLRNRRLIPVLLLGLVAAMSAGAPAVAAPDGNGTVCLVAEPAGFDDSLFNAGALAGAEKAAKRLHVRLETAEPGTQEGIAAVVDGWAASGTCDLIIGVGFIAGFAMEPALPTYPEQRFSVLDYVFENDGNAASVTFRADQPAFLAGYAAAAASESGVVATYGGAPFLSVTDFMNGFALGVAEYNDRRDEDVEVLGWDVGSQTGLFSGTFTDPSVGYTLTQDLFDQGADVVLPAAGATSQGSYDAAVERKAAGERVFVVWPDIDGYELFDRDRSRVVLTSAEKRLGVATYNQVEALVTGTWSPGVVQEDLVGEGVALAPFHRTQKEVPGVVRRELRLLEAAIIDGTVDTLP